MDVEMDAEKAPPRITVLCVSCTCDIEVADEAPPIQQLSQPGCDPFDELPYLNPRVLCLPGTAAAKFNIMLIGLYEMANRL